MAIKIVTIRGSVRPGNYTSKALRLALNEFAKHSDVEVTSVFLDQIELPLPGQRAERLARELPVFRSFSCKAVSVSVWLILLAFPKSRELVPIRLARPCAQVPGPGSSYGTSVISFSTVGAGQ